MRAFEQRIAARMGGAEGSESQPSAPRLRR
jgi:hypothetical protein